MDVFCRATPQSATASPLLLLRLQLRRQEVAAVPSVPLPVLLLCGLLHLVAGEGVVVQVPVIGRYVVQLVEGLWRWRVGWMGVRKHRSTCIEKSWICVSQASRKTNPTPATLLAWSEMNKAVIRIMCIICKSLLIQQ